MKTYGMGTWKTKKFKKTSKGSQTPGSTKVANCQTNPRKKFLLCHPHSHRLDPAKHAEMTAKLLRIN